MARRKISRPVLERLSRTGIFYLENTLFANNFEMSGGSLAEVTFQCCRVAQIDY
jgi:hypothetical protein